jgi:hypothetical protein
LASELAAADFVPQSAPIFVGHCNSICGRNGRGPAPLASLEGLQERRVKAFEAVTRLGFAARGVMYGAIGWLALRTGRTEDAGGVLTYLATGAGAFLVAVMAAGFFSYAAWRLLEAWLDTEGRGSDIKAIGVRLAGAGSGFIHLGFGIAAILAALHARRSGGGGGAPETGTALALALPGGDLLVYAGAAILAGVAVHQFRKAWTLKFMRHLDCSPAAHAWICWLGRAGYCARGAVFLTMAWLLLRAARAHSAAAAGGIDDALGALPRAGQLAVAAGVILFGLFSLTEARYRRMPATRR